MEILTQFIYNNCKHMYKNGSFLAHNFIKRMYDYMT